MKTTIIFAAFIMLLSGIFASAQNTSVYSTLNPAKCKTIESTSEEGGSYVGECKGVLGYKLQIEEGDVRQTVNIITPTRKKFELNLWHFYSAFSSVGKKA